MRVTVGRRSPIIGVATQPMEGFLTTSNTSALRFSVEDLGLGKLAVETTATSVSEAGEEAVAVRVIIDVSEKATITEVQGAALRRARDILDALIEL